MAKYFLRFIKPFSRGPFYSEAMSGCRNEFRILKMERENDILNNAINKEGFVIIDVRCQGKIFLLLSVIVPKTTLEHFDIFLLVECLSAT